MQSAIISGFSVMASMGSANEGKNVNSILWAANASINFSDYIKADTSVQQLKGLQESARKIMDEIKQQVLLFLHDKPDMIASFESTTKRLQADMADVVLTDRDRKQIADNARERDRTEQRKKYVEANQHIIEDTSSPYHTLKRDSIKLYEAWRLKKALITIDKALEIYKGEELLLQTRKQTRAAILTAGILIDIAIFIFGLYIVDEILFKGAGNSDLIDTVYVITSLVIIFYRASYRSDKYKPME